MEARVTRDYCEHLTQFTLKASKMSSDILGTAKSYG